MHFVNKFLPKTIFELAGLFSLFFGFHPSGPASLPLGLRTLMNFTDYLEEFNLEVSAAALSN